MSLFSLERKNIIVTGAGKGIGAKIAKEFARSGANLMLVSRTQSDLDLVAKEIQKIADVKVTTCTCDVSDEKAVESMVKKTVSTFGGIDVLLNNAGVNKKNNIIDVSLDDWKKIININLTGQFIVAQTVAKEMAKNEHGGSIINMASVGGFIALQNTGPYCASKGGVLQMTKVMANDLAHKKIRVNALCPGFIDTGLLHDEEVRQKLFKQFEAATPLGRVGEPDDMVGPAIFLASQASKYITGTYITIDGGMSCVIS